MLSSSNREALRIALSSILAHKLRSLLTLLGIIIGVASVVVVGAAISGLNSYVIERVSKVLGVNHFMIARMASTGRMTEEQWERMNRRNKRITWLDVDWMEKQCGSCTEVGAQLQQRVDLKREGQEIIGTRLAGVTASMGVIEDKTMGEGRFLLPHEVEHPANVCVIGMDIKDKFFPQLTPIDKTLKVRGIDFRIVGVEARRGSMFGESLDNQMYIPITTFERLFGRTGSLQIHGLAPDRETFEPTIDLARVVLRIRHKLKGNDDDDFGLVNVGDVQRDVDQFTGAIGAVVTPITLISLVVGGIVVMNIMLVSVNERTFEIGLRKAVGARRREILVQFLVESALLCAIGGVLGLLLASGLSSLISATTPIPMTVTVGYVVLSLVVSGSVGVVAGIYPAWRASKLDPVVALTPRMKRPQALISGDTLRMALDNVRAHKLRSFLTVLGVVIGVLVVVVIASILTGMRKNIVAMIEEYGTNNIFAFHLSTGPRVGPRDRAEYRRKPLKPEDGVAVKEQASLVEDVANSAFLWIPGDSSVAYHSVKYREAQLQGVSANYLSIVNLSLREGHFFSEDDDQARRNVLVIGPAVAEALFPYKTVVSGTELTLAGQSFRVIGVLEKRKAGGLVGEEEQDNLVFMPYRTARKVAPRSSEWMMLIVRARSGQVKPALEQVEEVLRRRRGLRANQPNDFDLSTADRFIEQFDSITAGIGLVAIAISSVGLMVGGIGVMNIMLVSVTERTQEIGVRKAIGARRRDIVRQFLFEAITLTLLGGLIGVLLAFLTSRILLVLLPSLPAEIPPWAVAAGLSVSIGVGLVFGVWPAKRAAALDPVEALRWE